MSVVMCTYNHGAYIGEALEGVLAQDFEGTLEVLVGDDASTDRTGEVVARLAGDRPSVVKHLRRATNLGPAANVTDLIRRSTGRYVAMCDGDDRWTDPTKIRRQVELLESRPDLVMSAHMVRVVDERGEPVSGREWSLPVPGQHEYELEDLMEVGPAIPHCSFLYRGDRLRAFGELGRVPRDWAFQLECARHGALHVADDVAADYRKHPGGVTTRSRASEARRRDEYRQLLWIAARVGSWTTQPERLARYVAHVHYGYACDSLERGRYLQFHLAIGRSVRAYPGLSEHQSDLHRLRWVMRLHRLYARLLARPRYAAFVRRARRSLLGR